MAGQGQDNGVIADLITYKKPITTHKKKQKNTMARINKLTFDATDYAIGTLDFGQIPIDTTSKNRRFHIYIMEGEVKLTGCWTNASDGAVLAARCPALLKCWLGKKSPSLYYWLVEVTYFTNAY